MMIKKGHSTKELAEKYGVCRSSIYKRVRYPFQSRKTPVEIKNKIIKKIKETFAENRFIAPQGMSVDFASYIC